MKLINETSATTSPLLTFSRSSRTFSAPASSSIKVNQAEVSNTSVSVTGLLTLSALSPRLQQSLHQPLASAPPAQSRQRLHLACSFRFRLFTVGHDDLCPVLRDALGVGKNSVA